MNNPFETLDVRLSNIESLLLDIKHKPDQPPLSDPEPESELLLTVNDLCKLFGKTKATIHTWKRVGIIPFHRISGRIYFKKDEIMDSLKKVEIQQER